MNFFQRQRDVRRLSRRLVFLFIIAVIGIVAVIDLVAALLLMNAGDGYSSGDLVTTLIWISAMVVLGIGLASWIKARLLRSGGGGKVAQQLGGIYVPEDTPDPRLRRLRNVVEEMAIASGTPVPEVYVLPNEHGINAFAAGFTPADAAVAVTHGALERLNRDELQGVIAHEFSHVVNGDMRLNIRLMGVLFGILVLTVVGRIFLHIRGRNPLPLIGIVLIIVGFIGVFVGRIIKAAVSRQREYLADASAVQYTRQSAGLAGALKKIAGLQQGSRLANDRAEEVSHMLFGEGFRFSSMFATHPPIAKRIQTLEPTFDPAQLQQLSQRWATAPPSGMQEDQLMGLTGGAGTLPAASTPVPVRPADVVNSVATSAPAAYQRASTILDSIPAPFLGRARDPDTVLPLVYGLLLSSNMDTRANQHAVIAARYGQGLADAAVRDAGELATLHPALRLPLAELAFPVLRRRARPAQEAVMACTDALIRVDGTIEVFEYCLSRLLHRELYEAMHHAPPWRVRRQTLAGSRLAVSAVLATLAEVGNPDPATAEGAFHAGASQVLPDTAQRYAPPERGVLALEPAWPMLDGLAGEDKARLVAGMVTVVSHDGVMTVSEVELVRTVCALLHCPLPPIVESQPDQVVPDSGPAR